MRFTTTLTTLTTLLLTTLSTALPANPIIRQTTCPRLHPPSTPRLNLLNRPDLGITTTQTLTFTLPVPDNTPADINNNTPLPGGPCTLRAVFPPHWEVIDTSAQAGGAPLAVDVYAVDGPAAGALVGTVSFAVDAGGDDMGRERVVVVNSFACRERMAYRFELAGVGEVGFVNGFDEGLGVEGGLEMVVGC
ncbi:uncharacterized protein B0H64DRAFT_440378 [Chaetomium fimeti]|uniref:Ubiquitin 3 binding protein But2 C-terminal domain-containing protein n=1 Tax=Chaetomium fimeti TaxID=1854472 RepID=A0AAE0LTN6_9PEZI|nr:hypothetical protein B0H64DRAFT_440378 [Chaetomium fimeti]